MIECKKLFDDPWPRLWALPVIACQCKWCLGWGRREQPSRTLVNGLAAGTMIRG